ncbi:MAG TPA: hypothetical protein DCG89_04965 [Spartobacteria bacterium]|nr:hypothetical protein [Spartobacteria bacterium]
MKRTVFISHSSKDKAIGDEVCRFLEANGVSCWIAPRDVTPGKNYGAAIVDAIDECAVFVLILSDDSNKSSQVVREVERAASTDSIIIPFRVDPVQPSRNLEFYVSSSHWLDATSKPLAPHLRELLQAITNWQASGAPEREQAALSTAPSPMMPVQRSRSWLTIAGVIAALVVVCALGLYFALRPRPVSNSKETQLSRTTASVPPIFSPSPAISLAATPAPSATVSVDIAANSPKVFPILPTPTIQPSASASSFLPTPSPRRMRPGEPIAAATSSTAAINPVNVSPSPAPASSARMKAAENLSTATIPIIQDVIASSQREGYRPYMAFDGNPATAWAPNKDGVDQLISVHFKAPVVITSVSIASGFGEDLAHYRMHNRVKTLRVTLSDGATQVLTFEDEMKMQRFELRDRAVTEWIKLEILSVFRGTKFDRTPISEIAFNREASN